MCVCSYHPHPPIHTYKSTAKLDYRFISLVFIIVIPKVQFNFFFSRAFAGSTPDITRLNPSPTASPSPALCDISHRCYSDRKPWEPTAIAWIVSRCRLWKKKTASKISQAFLFLTAEEATMLCLMFRCIHWMARTAHQLNPFMSEWPAPTSNSVSTDVSRTRLPRWRVAPPVALPTT